MIEHRTRKLNKVKSCLIRLNNPYYVLTAMHEAQYVLMEMMMMAVVVLWWQ